MLIYSTELSLFPKYLSWLSCPVLIDFFFFFIIIFYLFLSEKVINTSQGLGFMAKLPHPDLITSQIKLVTCGSAWETAACDLPVARGRDGLCREGWQVSVSILIPPWWNKPW